MMGSGGKRELGVTSTATRATPFLGLHSQATFPGPSPGRANAGGASKHQPLQQYPRQQHRQPTWAQLVVCQVKTTRRCLRVCYPSGLGLQKSPAQQRVTQHSTTQQHNTAQHNTTTTQGQNHKQHYHGGRGPGPWHGPQALWVQSQDFNLWHDDP